MEMAGTTWINRRMEGERGDFVALSPQETPFLFAHEAALELLRAERWRDGHYCPRCHGREIKRVNSFKITEMFQCLDCLYNFNSVSHTLFHGSKLPLHSHFQLLVLFDLSGADPALKDIAQLCGVTYRTVKMQRDKTLAMAPAAPYLSSRDGAEAAIGSYVVLEEFFAGERVALDPDGFRARLRTWLGR